MVNLHQKLDKFSPLIHELMQLGGTPSLSLTVATKNQPIYHANYGVRDLEAALPVTQDTIFPVCSLSKGISAAAMGILVERGVASWQMLAKDAVPSFHSTDSFLQDHTTLADIFSHRSGMSSCGNLVGGCEGNILIGKDDCMRVVNRQALVPEHLGSFAYNSTAYDLCDDAFENLSGMSVDQFAQQNLFDVLGLQRTFMTPPQGDTDNVSQSYNALDDATPYAIPCTKAGENGIGCSSGGLRSCASDLVKIYSSFVRSFNHELETGETSSPGSPLKQIAHLMSAQVPMLEKAENEISYSLGWARVQLPNTLGHIGLNGRLMPRGMPIIGRGVPSQLVLYHQGTLPGALAVVILVPDSESVVLVMSNSLSLTDVPDWVSQMVLEEILGVPDQERVNFISYAKASIAINLEWHEKVVRNLAQGRPDPTKGHRALEAYVGHYVDDSGVFSVTVTLVDDELFWALQGYESERYKLTHYNDDTFTWLQERNELSRRGRWVLGNDTSASFWKAEFRADGQGSVVRLLWRHDEALAPIAYLRSDTIQ